jgi:rhamnosyltransferase
MKPEVLVSVIIPVKNGDSWLDDTIPVILNQKIEGNIEIIAIDSGSTDNSLAILSKFNIPVISIRPEDFNHGLTRSLGVGLSNGKYIVMTVQDARPVSLFWLQELLNGFVDDTVAGVCGQQIVPHHPDKNPVEWFRPISTAQVRKYYFPDGDDFKRLSKEEQLAICRWDDVNAAYRKDILLRLPFKKTDFAEDSLWARDALLAGYAIVYNPSAQVEHYHYGNYRYFFQRNFIVQYHFYKYFGVRPVKNQSGVMHFLRVIKTLTKETAIPLGQKWKWLRYNYLRTRAIKKSNRLLAENLNLDGEQLDLLYQETCRSIPQALKKS